MSIGGVVSDERQLGQVVQAARKRAGFTQQALCQKSGLSYSTLAKIERGAIKSPSIFTIRHIADTLGIGLDQLMQPVPGGVAGTGPKKVSRSGVQFVYFDMNGCLIRAATTRAFTRLSKESGVPFEAIETLYWQYNNAVCKGDMTLAELNAAMSARLDLSVDWNTYYLAGAEPTPGVDELVGWVAENYHIGILTNAMPGQVAAMLKNGALPQVSYDAVVDSSEVQALKPEAKMYEVAAERAGVSPSELLLVDDDKVNLAGAAALGWHTMGFDPYHPEESIVAISTALEPAE